MIDDGVFYARALRRIDRVAWVLAGGVTLGVAVLQGWRAGVGCAIGAVLSFVNLQLWKRVANAVGPEGGGPSATALGLRYLLLGGVIFVIIKYFEVSLLAVLAGLLVSVAAVLLEILYELIFTSHSA